MKIQSILKQCGGAAIKLKNEKKNICKIVKIILLILLFLLGIYGVYYLFDTVFNGMILDWISNHFVHEERTGWYDGEQKVQYIYERVDWQAFKYIAVVSFVFLAGIIGSSVYIILHFSLKKQQKKLISRTAEMIHDYMKKECDVSEIFPQEFSEISTQLVQIKADMERKEQYLKMETQKKNDLITYLAHDLKTPLTSVMGYLNLLEDAPDMPLAQREKYTHIARKKAERLDSLIQEFFEITRYNLQNITLEKENIDLYYMLIQMKEEFYPVLAQKGNSIELKVPQISLPECLIILFGMPFLTVIRLLLLRLRERKIQTECAFSSEIKEKQFQRKSFPEYFRNFSELMRHAAQIVQGQVLDLLLQKRLWSFTGEVFLL